jgi:chemotaxis protein MotB
MSPSTFTSMPRVTSRLRATLRATLPAALVFVGAASFLTGCNNAQKDELAILKDKNEQLMTDLDSTKGALDGSETSRRALEEENARLRAIADTAATTPETGGATGGSGPELPKDLPAGVTARAEGNTVIIDVPGDVLFDSGKAVIKNDAKKTLDAVAKSIKASYPGKRISVEGFTDVDPIKKSKWADNWELGYERARAVGKFLVSKGFSESQFRYVSYGATDPKGSKKESRRVELSIVDAM